MKHNQACYDSNRFGDGFECICETPPSTLNGGLSPLPTWSENVEAWRLKTFGIVAPSKAYERAVEEIRELEQAWDHGVLDGLSDEQIATEAADVCIVLCGFVNSLGFDLAALIEKKMAKNRTRSWDVKDGVGYHTNKET